MKPEAPPPGSAERSAVLLVDDETELLQIMRDGLAVEFEVETAVSAGEAALLMAARRFAVVVCDHVMPGEGGLDFLVRMRELHPATRRILLTGYMNPELLSRSVAVAELSACLLKPVKTEELAAAVRAAVAG